MNTLSKQSNNEESCLKSKLDLENCEDKLLANISCMLQLLVFNIWERKRNCAAVSFMQQENIP